MNGKWLEIMRRIPPREYMRSCLGASPPAIDADIPEHILNFNIHLKIQPKVKHALARRNPAGKSLSDLRREARRSGSWVAWSDG
jgi:hypothetical protein